LISVNTIEENNMRKITRLSVLALSLIILVSMALPMASAQQTSILDEVRARGTLNCGVNGQVPGFSYLDPDSGQMLR
jgi:ABC-type amino acid transport substrate-binding protein